MRDQLDQLAADVQAAALTRPELESVVLQLRGQQQRLFLRLSQGPADTIALRRDCSVGNVSECARAINAKLAAWGDPRRVLCELQPHRNRFGERGALGVWRLVGAGDERRAA